MWIFIILLLLVIGFISYITLLTVNSVTKPTVYSLQEKLEKHFAEGNLDPEKLKKLRKESFSYKSEYGYTLSGTIINKKEGTAFKDGRERVVFLVHGWTSNQNDMLKYYPVFYNMGFSIVLYDQRNHGDSEKNFTSMGYYESKDLIGLISQIKPKFGQNALFGIMGESMGAATVMMSAHRIPGLSFAIEDCGYSSLKEEIKNTIKNKHLPSFLFLPLINLILKLKYNFSFNDVIPENSVKETENIPMLFCHGEKDTFVPVRMVYEVYKAKKGSKRIKTYPGSIHAHSYVDHKAEYTEEVRAFFNENNLL